MVNNGSKVLWLVKKPMHYLYMDIYMCMYVSFIYIHIIEYSIMSKYVSVKLSKVLSKETKSNVFTMNTIFPAARSEMKFLFLNNIFV